MIKIIMRVNMSIKSLPNWMSFINVIIFANFPRISKTCVSKQTVPASPASIPFISPIVPVELNSGLLFETLPWSDIHVAEVVICCILDATSPFLQDIVMEFFPCTTTFASKISKESEDQLQYIQYCLSMIFKDIFGRWIA